MKQGAKPFIVPAMGSHGGGIAEKQKRDPFRIQRDRRIHRHLVASMDTIKIAATETGIPIFMDRHAAVPIRSL